ncbi:hypothetical protein SJI19_02185 [Acerihabitans sp. TG2]|uniref:hypothetical protein n=1 Tax=Acerihabitans sp. TG2 TaxID=3096008 RepID=UPI002B2256FB|nr:hypothetical protein [Acerihabitans sp. TG2]MEA9389372.1 hypothetical protein [Acerihabitans sp. TG2]
MGPERDISDKWQSIPAQAGTSRRLTKHHDGEFAPKGSVLPLMNVKTQLSLILADKTAVAYHIKDECQKSGNQELFLKSLLAEAYVAHPIADTVLIISEVFGMAKATHLSEKIKTFYARLQRKNRFRTEQLIIYLTAAEALVTGDYLKVGNRYNITSRGLNYYLSSLSNLNSSLDSHEFHSLYNNGFPRRHSVETCEFNECRLAGWPDMETMYAKLIKLMETDENKKVKWLEKLSWDLSEHAKAWLMLEHWQVNDPSYKIFSSYNPTFNAYSDKIRQRYNLQHEIGSGSDKDHDNSQQEKLYPVIMTWSGHLISAKSRFFGTLGKDSVRYA